MDRSRATGLAQAAQGAAGFECSELGQGLAEYALILGLVVVLAVGVLAVLGTNDIASMLSSAASL